jgi:hypothetical protein
MFAAPDGLRVTLQDSTGRILAEDVSVDELRDRDPFAYEACHSALGRSGGDVDATLRLPSTGAEDGP